RFERLAGSEACQGHRRVEIIENVLPRCLQHELGGFDPIRAVRGDHRRVGVSQLAAGDEAHLVPRAIENEPPTLDLGQIAVLCVPGNIAFEKHDKMAATHQRADQRSPQYRMAVAPGGADRNTKNDEFHRGRYTSNRRSGSAGSWLETAAIARELPGPARAPRLR